MTPYEFAQDIAKLLAGLPLPTPILAQVGDIIVDCAGTWVSVTSTEERDIFNSPACGLVQMAEVQIISAFECSLTSDDEGFTDPKLLEAVSLQLDAYGEILREFVNNYVKSSFVEGTTGGIQFGNTGNLGIVTAPMTVPVP